MTPDDRRFDDFYRRVVELDVPLFVHGVTNDGRGPVADARLRRFGLDLIVGYTYEETLAASAFVLGGVLDRHPDLDVCLSHGGGAIAFLAQRFDSMAHFLGRESDFAASLRRLWFDSHLEPGPARDLVVDTVGIDRMVYGTNFGGWDTPAATDDFDASLTPQRPPTASPGGDRMTTLLITHARLFTAVDDTVIDDGSVLIDGDRIAWVGPTDELPAASVDGVEHLDVGGKFVMPGMTESHVHLSYSNAHPSQLDRQPIPIAMLDAVDNARTLLGFGFTSAISFGSAQGIDVPLRHVIDSGRVPGPRLLASEKDLGSTGSNADAAAPESEGRKRIADGPWAVRAAVREVAKAGADVVKIFLDGEAALGARRTRHVELHR